MKRTDVGKIQYPQGLSTRQRRSCRNIISSLADRLDTVDLVVVAASGGLDSTVLCHSLSQALRIRPNNIYDKQILATACYVNHNLRPKEVKLESELVSRMNGTLLSFFTPEQFAPIEKGTHLQERAREARYKALDNVCKGYLEKFSPPVLNSPSEAFGLRLWTAHTANDQAETKLYQFIKGTKVNGISAFRRVGEEKALYFVERPLLEFKRSQLEAYAESFQLCWCEDSSNKTDKYTRNKIRHYLIPWIEEHINPGIVDTMR